MINMIMLFFLNILSIAFIFKEMGLRICTVLVFCILWVATFNSFMFEATYGACYIAVWLLFFSLGCLSARSVRFISPNVFFKNATIKRIAFTISVVVVFLVFLRTFLTFCSIERSYINIRHNAALGLNYFERLMIFSYFLYILPFIVLLFKKNRFWMLFIFLLFGLLLSMTFALGLVAFYGLITFFTFFIKKVGCNSLRLPHFFLILSVGTFIGFVSTFAKPVAYKNRLLYIWDRIFCANKRAVALGFDFIEKTGFRSNGFENFRGFFWLFDKRSRIPFGNIVINLDKGKPVDSFTPIGNNASLPIAVLLYADFGWVGCIFGFFIAFFLEQKHLY